jgi:hypothetical protein
MKHILCIIGKHNMRPKQVFTTNVIDENKKVVKYAESWHGFQCSRCTERTIKKEKYEEQSPGATQQAYDWVNSNEPENPTMLKTVQK